MSDAPDAPTSDAPTSDERVEELIEGFEFLDDWDERFRYIIDLGRKLKPMPEALKSDETKVDGCTSQVWMVARIDGDPPRITFLADSDAHIVRGLIAILMALYDSRTAREILDLDAEGTIARLDLAQHLSPNRANGLFAMVGRIRTFAADALAADATV
jgi:cysteine desulfuration protein SufE